MTAGTPTSAFDAATIERFADLAVGFGANVQPGQIVAIGSRDRQGAADPRARRQRLPARREVRRRRSTSTCTSSARGSSTPPRTRSTSCRRGTASGSSSSAASAARGSGSPARRCPGLLDDLDPARAGRDQLPALQETGHRRQRRTTNWTIVPVPDRGLGAAVHPDLDARTRPRAPGRADRPRLPPGRGRSGRGLARARRDASSAPPSGSPSRRFDALHFVGAGHRPHRRAAAHVEVHRRALRDRRRHPCTCRTCPSEEVFTAPDPQRADGRRARDQAAGRRRARSSAGSRSSSATGRAVRIDADENAEVAARLRGARRGRGAPGRGRAGRRRRPHRPARHGVLRHAARRERRQPHRARPGLRVHRGRRGPRAAQRLRASTSTS